MIRTFTTTRETSTNENIIDADVIEIKNKPYKVTSMKVIDENGNVNLDKITEIDKKRYNELTRSLNITDINSISNYGSELQSQMSKYSNDLLNAVRAQQSGEMGELISNLLGELEYIDVNELKTPNKMIQIARKLPIVKHFVKSIEHILKKYDTIEKNVEDISKKIAITRLSALRDNNALCVMFNNNVEYGKQIDELIVAGKLKLNDVENHINEMENNTDCYEPYEIQDAQEFAHNLERRVNDMITLRYVVKQSLVQIRTVQYNNIAVADKANSIIATTIPVWKNQLSLAVALNNQKGNIDAQKRVTETTNLILKKNAELLKQNSIIVAKENERSVVDVETLRETTNNLINTIREVKRIHEEGYANRKAAESEILRIESELDKSMTSISN